MLNELIELFVVFKKKTKKLYIFAKQKDAIEFLKTNIDLSVINLSNLEDYDFDDLCFELIDEVDGSFVVIEMDSNSILKQKIKLYAAYFTSYESFEEITIHKTLSDAKRSFREWVGISYNEFSYMFNPDKDDDDDYGDIDDDFKEYKDSYIFDQVVILPKSIFRNHLSLLNLKYAPIKNYRLQRNSAMGLLILKESLTYLRLK